MILKAMILTTVQARWVMALVSAGVIFMAAAGLARAGTTPLETAMDAVLTVKTNDAENRFLGSAFLWGEVAEVAVTNAHVVGQAEEVLLIDRHGNEEVGLVIAVDVVRDVAVISLAPRADGTIRAGLVAAPGPAGLGLEVFALGAPLGIEFTLTEGMISATARQVQIAVPLMMLQHDAAVNPGSSGGPLVDAEGRLLGMNSQIADGSRMFVGIAYAIAAADLERIVTGLIEETLPAFPALGLTARPVDRKVAGMLGIDERGILVDGVTEGSIAKAAGLQPGDVILAVGGVDLAAAGDMAFLIEVALVDGETTLTVLRGGDKLDLTLPFTLTEAEDAPGIGVKLRDVSLKDAGPKKTTSYRLAALGMILAGEGRVDEVTENSPALFAGVARGDRIVAVNGQNMDLAALQALEITEAVMLLIASPDGSTRHVFLDPWGGADGVRPVGGANVLDPDVVVF